MNERRCHETVLNRDWTRRDCGLPAMPGRARCQRHEEAAARDAGSESYFNQQAPTVALVLSRP